VNRSRRLILLAGAIAPFGAWAQVSRGSPRIAFLSTYSRSDNPQLRAGFLRGLREAGYVEGQSIVIEWRFADRKTEHLPRLAAELIAMNPRVIVTETTPAVRAAKQATSTIPIVMTGVADAVGSGLVSGLARPDANVTGMTFLGTELVGKRLELLKQAIPTISEVAVLRHPGAHGDATARRMRDETEVAARAMGLSTQVVDAPSASDLPAAFNSISREKASAVLVWPSPMFLAERKQLAALAVKHRLPTMYYLREYAEAGGLMSYGPNLPELCRRSAMFVDKLLRGARPADLPVEQPSRFEFVVNLAAARETGVSIPEALLVRADEVIRG
jgi:putative ABC transport system substrate-binding protein